MHFRFLLADPQNDIELLPRDLEQPFRLSPSENHPFLTLRDYFGALQEFLLLDDKRHLHTALKKLGPPGLHHPEDIAEILIRSEKHGAFYHIASITLSGSRGTAKFALTTALSGPAGDSLLEEYTILQDLAAIMPDHLPELFCLDDVTRQTAAGQEGFRLVMGEWLEGYHEWHLRAAPPAAGQKIELWDYEKGFRNLTDAESYELLRQVAFILTGCYDQATYRQIYPWHHGAGDFVARAAGGTLSVKLITARQYGPLVDFDGEEENERIVAAIHFLLNLVLRIRLDRVNGTGEPAWLEGFAVDAALAGFFSGLAAAGEADRLMIGPAADFLEIMQSFAVREIFDMYASLLELYAEEDLGDFVLIRAGLADHAEQLHGALQRFQLLQP